MKRFYHKLLSSIVSFMLIITASFVPELFNFSIANANVSGPYQADSGVFELDGISTNDHTDAHYLWENSGKIYVAFTVLHRSVGNILGIEINDLNITNYYEFPSSSTNLYITDSASGTVLLDQSSAGKVGTGYHWVVAEVQLPNGVPRFIDLTVRIRGNGHTIEDIRYTVVGALEVYNEYPPTSPVLDESQSLGTNTLGGIAAGSYTFNPTPTLGFEYTSVVLEIDNVVIGTAVVGSPFSYTFADGTINVSESGVITLVLTKASAREYDFIYSYQLSDYLLTIHYEYEDGSTAFDDHTATLNYQDPYSVVSPTLAGYTPSLSTVSGTMPASNRTVTVTYTAIDYTFTFVPNWGSVLNEVRSFNVGGSVIPPVFTRDGYTFKGWTSDQAGLNLYVDGFTNLTVGNKTVYAQWEAIDYTFTFVPNWGSELSVDRIFNVGGSVTPPVFTRTGFTFTGWSLDVEGTQTYTQFSNLTSGNKTVYAQWSQNNYSFTFDPNFGDGANVVQMFNFGGSVAGTSFTRLGYTFDGWTLDEAGLIPYTGGLTNLPAENIYVYAQWEAIDYTFTFDPNFGDGANVVQSFNVGGSVAGTTFTRLGYTFDGWTLDEAGLTPYTGGLTNLPAENIYVYAQWEAIDYTFTFDPNFGDGANVVQGFNVGGSVAGTVFVREGFDFVGWTLDEEGLIDYEGGLTDLPAENIYVYAQWAEVLGEEDETFVLRFVTNMPGLTYFDIVFSAGDSITPPAPVVEGYDFLGWFIDEEFSELFEDFDNMPARDVTVFADWGEVLGEEEEIPQTSDNFNRSLAFFLFILGLLATTLVKKEEENV